MVRAGPTDAVTTSSWSCEAAASRAPSEPAMNEEPWKRVPISPPSASSPDSPEAWAGAASSPIRLATTRGTELATA